MNLLPFIITVIDGRASWKKMWLVCRVAAMETGDSSEFGFVETALFVELSLNLPCIQQ